MVNKIKQFGMSNHCLLTLYALIVDVKHVKIKLLLLTLRYALDFFDKVAYVNKMIL